MLMFWKFSPAGGSISYYTYTYNIHIYLSVQTYYLYRRDARLCIRANKHVTYLYIADAATKKLFTIGIPRYFLYIYIYSSSSLLELRILEYICRRNFNRTISKVGHRKWKEKWHALSGLINNKYAIKKKITVHNVSEQKKSRLKTYLRRSSSAASHNYIPVTAVRQ